MQSVLCVDVTVEPAVLVVADVYENRVELRATRRRFLAPLQSADGAVIPTNTDQVPGTAGDVQAAAEKFIADLPPWTSALVIAPPDSYHSLLVKLPFGDAKNIDRVVDLEVQDLVPFDVAEFVVHPRVVGSAAVGVAPNFDVHVGLAPRVWVKSLVDRLRQEGVEPYVVCPPMSVFAAWCRLAPAELTTGYYGIVLIQGDYTHVAICQEQAILTDRTIAHKNILTNDTIELLREIRLTVAAAEQRLGSTINKICYFGSLVASAALADAVGRAVKPMQFSDLFDGATEETGLAVMGAFCAQDKIAPTLLTNFRTRDLAYRPRLGDFLAVAKRLAPLLLALVCVVFIGLIAIFWIRSIRINGLRQAMSDQVSQVIPSKIDILPGEELRVVQREAFALDGQLKDLGSPSSISPLDSLLEISKDLPANAGVNVSRIRVKSNKIVLEVTAPDYTAAEVAKAALEKRKSVYCRVKMDTTSGQNSLPGVRGFTFEVWLCD